MPAEQLTLIRATGDASGYEKFSRDIEGANARISASTRQLENGGERTQRTVTQTARQFDRLVQSLDSSARAAAQFAAAEQRINAAVTAGHASLEQKNRLLALARERYLGVVPAANAAAAAVGEFKLRADQSLNLGFQLQDFAIQVGSGGGLFRPLLQQAPQAVGAVGGLSNAFTLLRQNAAALATGAGILGAVAALGLIAGAAERNQRSINGLATGLQRTRADYTGAATEINAAARRLAETTSLGTQEARDALGQLASVPGFNATRENLIEMGRLAQNVGAAFREDTADGARRVAELLRDPAAFGRKAAEEGAEGIRGFNAAVIRQIELLQTSGDRAGAAALALRVLKAAVDGAADRLTPLQQAWRDLNEEMTRAGNVAGRESAGIGSRITSGLASGLDTITGLVRLLNQAAEAWDRLTLSSSRGNNANLVPFRDLPPGAVLPPAGGGGASGPAVPARQVASEAVGYFIAQGWTPQQAAGIVANLNAESGMRPGAVGDGGRAYGLAQWHPDRQAEFARVNGRPIQDSSTQQQLAFIQYELTQGRERAAGERLRATTTAEDAGAVVSRYYERPGATPEARDAEAASRARAAGATFRLLGTGTAPATAAPATPAATTATPGPAAASATPSAPAGAAPLDPAATAEADRAARLRASQERGDSLRYQRETVGRQLATAEADLAATPRGTPAFEDRTAEVQRYRAELERLQTPQQQMIERLQRQNDVGGELDPTMRAVRQRVEEYNESVRQSGRGQQDPDVVRERAQVEAEAIRTLTQEHRQQVTELDRNIAGQGRIAAAWAQGATAAAEATNRERALNEVRASGIVGDAARGAEVERLTARYNALTAAQAAASVNQRLVDNGQALDTIAAQRRLVGADPVTAAQDLAGLKARQDASRVAGITPADTDRLVGSAREIAAAQQALGQYQQAWKSVEGVASSAIDKMGEGLLKFTMGGKDAFKQLRATAASTLQDIAKEILKMGVLNPIKNSLFGGNQPTFGGLSAGGDGGGLGIGGFLSSLFSSGTGAIAKEGGKFAAESLASSAVFAFHSGGIAGEGAGLMRTVPNAIFREAPRYHSGGFAGSAPGLMPDEVPAVLRRRELVMTEGQQAATRRAIAAPRTSINQTIQINAANVDSFRASGGQAKATMAKAIRSAARNL